MFSPILLFKHFYIFIILGGFANYFSFRKRAKTLAHTHPDLTAGNQKILKAILIYGNLPWIFWGIGVLCGRIDSPVELFQPADLNPFVLLVHACILLIYFLLVKFVFFNNGAAFLEKHMPIFQHPRGKGISASAIQIKIFTGVMIFFGLTVLTALWFVEIPFEEIPFAR